jgi:hypothetical protein
MVPELVDCAKSCDPVHKSSDMSMILRMVKNGRREVSRIVESPLEGGAVTVMNHLGLKTDCLHENPLKNQRHLRQVWRHRGRALRQGSPPTEMRLDQPITVPRPRNNTVEGLIHLLLAARKGRQIGAVQLLKVIRKYHESGNCPKEMWKGCQIGEVVD